MSTARIASCASNIQRGDKCAPPINPASSGSWRMGRRSTGTLSAFRMTAARPMQSSPTPAGAGSAAHHDPFGIAPRFELEEMADDERKLLREILNRPLHNAGGLGVPLCEQRIELLPADLLARLVPERIVAGFAQRLAPALEDRAERALVGAVAGQPFVVLQFAIVAFALDLGRAGRRHARQRLARSWSDRQSLVSTQAHDNREAPKRFRRVGQRGEVGATIRRTMSIARRISVSDASRVRNAACDVSVTFSMPASG